MASTGERVVGWWGGGVVGGVGGWGGGMVGWWVGWWGGGGVGGWGGGGGGGRSAQSTGNVRGRYEDERQRRAALEPGLEGWMVES